MTKDRKDAEAVVRYVIADGAQQGVSDYAARGRRLRSTSDDELRSLFVAAYGRWALNPMAPDIQRETDDINAEYTLRGQSCPFDLVSEQVEAAINKVAAGLLNLDEETRARIDGELHRRYDEAHRNKN
ncbi:hypothetical protein ACMDCR_25780 [Labrys okinawensis]|uniref:hypothetical protein n=1 Tax=Labrys okinawensis TaxID=346911 RepID=UPI0039BD7F67